MFPARFFPWKFFPKRQDVAPGESQKARIHAALLQVASLGTFPEVTYDGDGAMVVGASVPPATILANEISSAHLEQARHWRRGAKQDRNVWKWRLYLAFNQEVTLEVFEDGLAAAPRWIPATSELRQVQLFLKSTTYHHPVTHDATVGTTVTFEFDAVQTAA